MRGRSIASNLLLLVGSVALGVAAIETGLRVFDAYVAGRSEQPPNMFRHDPALGWRLTPSWRGHHVHYDFELDYTTNAFGYRGEFTRSPEPGRGDRWAVLGDSFTFGMGSADADTFVARLNERAEGSVEFLNFGVPGYSTDQEVLLIEGEVFSFRPSHILLVVYLGNDLIDNEESFPLSAVTGKPRFERGEGGLVLRSPPPPGERKPAELRALALDRIILGVPATPTSGLAGFLRRSTLLRRLLPDRPPPGGLSKRLEERLAPTLELFAALVERARREAEARGVGLSLVLVASRSFVERPDSLIARDEDHLRRGILARDLGVPVVDLAAPMRGRFAAAGERFYNPREGHFSPRGNAFAARLLWEHAQSLSAGAGR